MKDSFGYRDRLAWQSWVSTPCAPLQVRADLNVPLDKDLNITDDTRIRAAIPTLKYLTDNGAKVLLTSHLVRRAPSESHLLALQQQELVLWAVWLHPLN